MTELAQMITNLARLAVESHVKNDEYLFTDYEAPFLAEKRACFVCLKKDGILRGCIGTLSPACDSLKEEIIKNAISAAVCDYRFSPVTPKELKHLSYSVDVLSPLEPATEELLDPGKYGVLVKNGLNSGVLLPDLEGVDTVKKQLAVARDKAGLGPDEKADLYRFTVKRFQ